MAARVLVTGATGQLGAYLIPALSGSGGAVVAWGRREAAVVAGPPVASVDLTDPARVAAEFRRAAPDVVIHAAAMSAVGDCARDPARAAAVNTGGTEALAALCAPAGARLVFVSTDLVFDGEAAPYPEDAAPSPLSVYGRTKAAAERAVLAGPRNAVVRVSLLFGPSRTGTPNFFDSQVAALRGGRSVRLFHDEWRTPLSLATAARALAAIARSDLSGVVHVGGPERMSRLDMGRRLAGYLGLDSAGIEPVGRSEAGGEPRPRDTSLVSARWRDSFPDCAWPTFGQALAEMGVR